MRIVIMVRLIVVAALISAGMAHVAVAQSLGEVARKEEERRKALKSPGKVYTNETLRPEPLPSAPPVSASGVGVTEPATTPPATTPTPEPAPASGDSSKGDEASWRQRMQSAREALQRSQTFADALQSQINGLTTDFVNRDDPAQRSVIAANRDKAIAELDRIKKEVAAQTKAISDIQDEARRAGVPAGWVR